MGRELLLTEILSETKRTRWPGDFDNPWKAWDISLVGDCWHRITLRSVSEELGNNQRFTRVRIGIYPTLFQRILLLAILAWTCTALLNIVVWGLVAAAIAALAVGAVALVSRERCLRAVTTMINRSAAIARLIPYDWRDSRTQQPPAFTEEPQIAENRNRKLERVKS